MPYQQKKFLDGSAKGFAEHLEAGEVATEFKNAKNADETDNAKDGKRSGGRRGSGRGGGRRRGGNSGRRGTDDGGGDGREFVVMQPKRGGGDQYGSVSDQRMSG